jgi:hypothetical protein
VVGVVVWQLFQLGEDVEAGFQAVRVDVHRPTVLVRGETEGSGGFLHAHQVVLEW